MPTRPRPAPLALALLLSLIALLIATPVLAQDETDEDDEGGAETKADKGAKPAGEAKKAEEEGEEEKGGEEKGGEEKAPASQPASQPAGPTGPSEVEENPGIYAPTTIGATGLFRVVTGDIGMQHTFRVGLRMEIFKGSDFLVTGDDDSRFGATLSLSYTPWKYLEAYLNAKSQVNSNVRPPETNRLDQEVILALGDFALGAKGQYPITRFLSIGGNFLLQFLNGVGGISFDAGSTSFYIGLLSTFDLDPLAHFPLRFHLNAGWLLDNSNNLVDSSVWKNYSLSSLQVEKFALGINRDRVQIKFGTDLPLRRWTKIVGVTPIIEFATDIATTDRDADFNDSRFKLSNDQLVGRATLWLTVGVRVNPYVKGLNIDLGTDIGLVSPGYAYGPPVIPWNLLVGLSYSYDPVERVKVVTKVVPKEVVREVEKRPPSGKLRGRVVNAKTLEPIEGAVVTFPGKDFTGLYTDPDGTFLSYEFPVGTHAVMVRHPDFVPGKLTVEIKPNAIVAQDIKLEPAAPKVGKVVGKVVDIKGQPVAATVTLTGPETKTESVGADGGYASEVKNGPYSVSVTAKGFLRKEAQVNIQGGTTTLDFTLSAKPKRALVQVTKKAIVIKKEIHFGTDNAEIQPDSTQLLDAIVDVLLSNPNIKRVEIGGHTDNRGKPEHNQMLSQSRADAVRDYLVKNGVAADRLVAKGYGASSPKVPNITARGRALNRRVEFLILEQ